MSIMKQSQKGFTLVETLIAIFILALTIGALLTLTAGGFFSIRYAKNDIVASNLLQESLEYIRNSRDTAAQQGQSWGEWGQQFENCFEPAGCIINTYPQSNTDVVSMCGGVGFGGQANDCDPMVYLVDQHMYVQPPLATIFGNSGTSIPTSFVRNILFEQMANAQIKVTARIDWKNGINDKHVTQSIILTPWNIRE